MATNRSTKAVIRLSAAVLGMLLWSASAHAAPRAHASRLDESAASASESVPLGPTDPDTRLEIVLGLGWERQAELDALLRDLADPQSARFQKFVSADEFVRRFAPTQETLDAVASFVEASGMRVTQMSPSRLFVRAEGTAANAERAFSVRLNDVWVRGRRQRRASAHPRLPSRLNGRVLSLQGLEDAVDLQPPGADPVIPPQLGAPFQPADIARVYEFQSLYDRGFDGSTARASTIAVATAFGFDSADLERFWKQFGIRRNLFSVELVAVTGPIHEMHSETVLDIEWASAMASSAPILVYAGADASSATFLAVYDRIVNDNRAAVLTTSWGRCEEELPPSYLQQVNAIFQRAAAQGITVIAASGDAGAFGCGTDEPAVSFPASSPYALAVGGTTAHEDESGVEEMAWSGSGGGTSVKWAAPAWQMQPNAYRVMSDVALNADPETPYLTAYEGDWWYFGGTSVGAPIWAALVALSNQVRAANGRPTLGLAAPALCEVAYARGLSPKPLRDITGGHNRVYSAERGWDFPTGWGTPRASLLADALATWTPSADAAGGRSESIVLRALGGDTAGSVRLRFRRRCLTEVVQLRIRGVAPGSYTLDLDGVPAASFEVGALGRASVDVPDVDPRGSRIAISNPSGVEVFTGGFVSVAEESSHLTLEMMNTGAVEGARGTVYYRAGSGREELTVWAQALPAGTYDVRVGDLVVGSLIAPGVGHSVLVRFDSARAESPLAVSPICKSVTVMTGGIAYLRSKASALTFGGCG